MTTEIQRMDSNERLSRIVIHNHVAYVAGVTASNAQADVYHQTLDALAKIDTYLAQAGTDKSRLLTAQIWLRDIDRDFAGMNAAWGEWIDGGAVPTRATCEARLARPDLLVEIIVSAAV
ncbi:RidA family protein [Castellaniella defragrans]|jgi:enamine deaminase RidA (YjgF/YER057c/UK114 family)|uniref:RidA n=2 Tax=Castellaniella defragrans TaxID=75697 RepID=W8X0D6_CASD6|nr:RidA family protein [Castellaniella defragrans]KAB0608385.1 RidA family protein [Castellaniella defragrans]MBB6083194.1 enamine deaminase RidA (YjgF/YER057c/UK114 family) [Castellaniella defragrans]CDM25344.1 RidA [Castellaniella defragrans 65Phen]